MTGPDDLSHLTRELMGQWEAHLATLWGTVLGDRSTLQALGEGMATRAALRSQWEQGVDRSMHAMHLPSRQDLTRLARIVSALEDRLVALEDAVLAQADTLATLERDNVVARIETAEILLGIQASLDAVHRRLDAHDPAPTQEDPA